MGMNTAAFSFCFLRRFFADRFRPLPSEEANAGRRRPEIFRFQL
jgi:hypothetical protein